MPFPTVEFLLQNSSCKGKKKKVRSCRTDDEGEDMSLPIIQKKEKGFTKKHPKAPPKLEINTRRQQGRRMMHHFSRDSPKKHAQLLNRE